METIVDKHPALSLQDIKLAGEFIHGICEPFGFPKSTAMLAESLFWRHLNRTTQRQRATLRELILACLFIAIKLESSDIARNSFFMDAIATLVSRDVIIEEELRVLESVNWRPLEHADMIGL